MKKNKVVRGVVGVCIFSLLFFFVLEYGNPLSLRNQAQDSTNNYDHIQGKLSDYITFNLQPNNTINQAILRLYIQYDALESPVINVYEVQEEHDTKASVMPEQRHYYTGQAIDQVVVLEDGWYEVDVTKYMQKHVASNRFYVSFQLQYAPKVRINTLHDAKPLNPSKATLMLQYQ